MDSDSGSNCVIIDFLDNDYIEHLGDSPHYLSVSWIWFAILLLPIWFVCICLYYQCHCAAQADNDDIFDIQECADNLDDCVYKCYV